MANGNGRVSWEWVWRIFSFALIPTVAVLGGVVSRLDSRIDDLRDEIHDMEIQVEVISGNRWSSRDQNDFSMLMWQALNKKADLSDVPPDWHRAEFSKLEERVNRYHDNGR